MYPWPTPQIAAPGVASQSDFPNGSEKGSKPKGISRPKRLSQELSRRHGERLLSTKFTIAMGVNRLLHTGEWLQFRENLSFAGHPP